MYKGRKVAVIIAAGGAGTRFGAEGPKQFLDVGGRSMAMAAAAPFVECGYADWMAFAVPEGYEGLCARLAAEELGAVLARRRDGREAPGVPGPDGREALGVHAPDGREVVLRVVTGGADRAASVRAGLEAAEADGMAGGLVLIHDAARPFVTAGVIGRVLEAADRHGAAAPAVPVLDTVYITDGDGFALKIPDRAGLRAVQTPQGFDFASIRDAHRRAFSEGISVTDDGAPVLAGGGRVALAEGDPANAKITMPGDLPGGLRAGIGFDAHRFCEGRALVLGGLEIPFEKGLLGHSDADVLAHALMDAILGALKEGDIGRMFPDTDPAYAGVSSMRLLGEVVSLMERRGYSVVNADMTLVAERPRMAPYREGIERGIARALGTAPENVSLKATTTERLGFTGREEGIAAEAVVLIENKKNG